MVARLLATAAMVLVDRQQLDLDAPVSQWLPALGALTVAADTADGPAVPVKTAVTTRQLMSHTSGLSYAFFDGCGAAGVSEALDRCHRLDSLSIYLRRSTNISRRQHSNNSAAAAAAAIAAIAVSAGRQPWKARQRSQQPAAQIR